MARPSDWHVVGLAHDPVPGDPAEIRMLARKYEALTPDIDDAGSKLSRAALDSVVTEWDGDAADAFREKLQPIPGRARTASDALATVVTALREWADAVDDAQSQADRALSHARAAHADLTLKNGSVTGASDAFLQRDAQSRLAAATRSIRDATESRSQAEQDAVSAIRVARDDSEKLLPRPVMFALQDLTKLQDRDVWESMFGSGADYRRFAADLRKLSPLELNEFLASLSASQLAALSAAVKANGAGRFGGQVSNWDRQALLGELFAGADAAQLARLTKTFAWAQPFHGISTTLLGELFDPTTPEWTQVRQGQYGDCTWMSSLIAATRRNPQFAEEHVRPNANGTVSVLLYNDQGRPQWITVTGTFEIKGNQLMFAHGDATWAGTPTWVTYYEKALAQATDNSWKDPGATGTYDSISQGNDPQVSMPTVTGHPAADISADTKGAYDQVAAAARAGKIVTIATPNADHTAQLPGYVPGHDFYFKSFDSKGDMIFGNPWSPSQATITVTPDNLSRYFDVATVG
ncbi:MAG: WXG100 family type VII secretion target [Pseudolysinimonas sp.]